MSNLLRFPMMALFRFTDEEAMRRVQAGGDEGAFECLVERWEEPIRRLCTRMTGDEHLGQDLAQEAFTRVYTRRTAYRAGSKFSTWLWRIALNLCYDELRRRRRRAESSPCDQLTVENILENTADEERLAPDQSAQSLDTARLVQHAVQRLSQSHRTILVLRHYENLKFREIAEVLEIPEGTVKSRMAEALSQLQRLLRTVLQCPPPSSPTSTPQPQGLVV